MVWGTSLWEQGRGTESTGVEARLKTLHVEPPELGEPSTEGVQAERTRVWLQLTLKGNLTSATHFHSKAFLER